MDAEVRYECLEEEWSCTIGDSTVLPRDVPEIWAVTGWRERLGYVGETEESRRSLKKLIESSETDGWISQLKEVTELYLSKANEDLGTCGSDIRSLLMHPM
jgi:hypothetical protein